jgi:hypothetical protein
MASTLMNGVYAFPDMWKEVSGYLSTSVGDCDFMNFIKVYRGGNMTIDEFGVMKCLTLMGDKISVEETKEGFSLVDGNGLCWMAYSTKSMPKMNLTKLFIKVKRCMPAITKMTYVAHHRIPQKRGEKPNRFHFVNYEKLLKMCKNHPCDIEYRYANRLYQDRMYYITVKPERKDGKWQIVKHTDMVNEEAELEENNIVWEVAHM